MAIWKIGCSGYHYPEWKGMFYPTSLRSREWFKFYAKHFNCMEFNVTFYKFPRVESLSPYYDRAPHEYSFSVKAPRLISISENSKMHNATSRISTMQ